MNVFTVSYLQKYGAKLLSQVTNRGWPYEQGILQLAWGASPGPAHASAPALALTWAERRTPDSKKLIKIVIICRRQRKTAAFFSVCVCVWVCVLFLLFFNHGTCVSVCWLQQLVHSFVPQHVVKTPPPKDETGKISEGRQEPKLTAVCRYISG